MTIVLRSVKGSNLEAAEVDGNFTDLDSRVSSIENDSALQGEGIQSIHINGAVLTITGTRGTNYGSFDLGPAIQDEALLYALAF